MGLQPSKEVLYTFEDRSDHVLTIGNRFSGLREFDISISPGID